MGAPAGASASDSGRPERTAAIALDTAGGDTWTFDRPITGNVASAACNSVIVESPAGEVRAVLQGRHFLANIHLHSGINAVRASCRRAAAPTVRSKVQYWNVRLEDRPRARIRTRTAGELVSMDAGASERAAGIPVPIEKYEWLPDPHNPAVIPLAQDKRIQFASPIVDGEYRVTLHVTDTLGRHDESTTVFRVSKGIPAEVDVERTPPDWLAGGIVYGAAPTLLTPVGFEGVMRRLDGIVTLGANAIWLTPVTAAPPGDFGYAVTNHFQVRDAFGSQQQLRALIDAAHARGLRVLLDFVTNHLSNAHPYYVDAERRGAASPYYGWFERDPSGKVVHYFDWTNLENLDYDNPDVRAYMIAACSYWVRVFHLDGFRMDAAWALRERAPEFWPELRRELKRIDPDIVLLAEASARDPYYRTHGFDAAYDWTDKLGEWAWQSAYADGEAAPDLNALRAALADDNAPSGTGFAVLRFLDNNDTGARFVTRHGIDQTRTAAAMLLTLPGLPLIFDGDEVGAAFDPYRGGAPIVWRDLYGLEPFYSRLVKLRHDVAALRSSSMELLDSDERDTVLAYERGGEEALACREAGKRTSKDQRESECEPSIVVINFGAATVDISLPSRTAPDTRETNAAVTRAGASAPLPGQGPSGTPPVHHTLGALIATRIWLVENLVTGATFQLGAGASTLRLSPHDALLLRPPPPTG